MNTTKTASASNYAGSPPSAAALEVKWADICKRAFDILAAGVGLVALSPLLALIAMAIKISDRGPVFHRRLCVGKDADAFEMYKFRSMRQSADDLPRWLTPRQIDEFLKEQKMDNDPRVTRLGAFLRKWSLDELPQLVNVLRGDMSMVGPRPITRAEQQCYGDRLAKFQSVRPGITGCWQIYGRGNCTYESGRRQQMELSYIDQRCFGLDMKLVFLTIPAVLSRKGAK